MTVVFVMAATLTWIVQVFVVVDQHLMIVVFVMAATLIKIAQANVVDLLR
jgi:hypothetical protein